MTRSAPSGRLARLPKFLWPLGLAFRNSRLHRVYRRGLRGGSADLVWLFDQRLRRGRIALLSKARLEELKRELMEGNTAHRPDCLITITFSSRQFGNRDNRLEFFLESLLRTTEKPERVEILIKVDDDDDLLFYRKVRRAYAARIDLRFLVYERGGGPADFHLFSARLLKLRSPSSRIWFASSEDALFILERWDAELATVVERYPHNCFIGGSHSFEDTIAIRGPNPVAPEPVYWIGDESYGFVGMGLIQCLETVAQKYPGWTCLGNTFNMDTYLNDILRKVWQRHRLNLHVQTRQFLQRTGVFRWVDNAARRELRSSTLIRFLADENQKVREEMADATCDHLRRHGVAMASAGL